MNKVDYAVAVIGGGPAGAVAARVLAQAGVDNLLVDARSPEGFRVGESLVPAARTILTELGLWDRFLGSDHVPCYGNMAAWGSSELVEMDFIRSPYGHGWHLDRTTLRSYAARHGRRSGCHSLQARKTDLVQTLRHRLASSIADLSGLP